jgi:hypothetical protein
MNAVSKNRMNSSYIDFACWGAEIKICGCRAHNELLTTSNANLLTTQPKNQQLHSRKKATSISEFVTDLRLHFNCGVLTTKCCQYHWQLKAASAGMMKLR